MSCGISKAYGVSSISCARVCNSEYGGLKEACANTLKSESAVCRNNGCSVVSNAYVITRKSHEHTCNAAGVVNGLACGNHYAVIRNTLKPDSVCGIGAGNGSGIGIGSGIRIRSGIWIRSGIGIRSRIGIGSCFLGELNGKLGCVSSKGVRSLACVTCKSYLGGVLALCGLNACNTVCISENGKLAKITNAKLNGCTCKRRAILVGYGYLIGYRCGSGIITGIIITGIILTGLVSTGIILAGLIAAGSIGTRGIIVGRIVCVVVVTGTNKQHYAQKKAHNNDELLQNGMFHIIPPKIIFCLHYPYMHIQTIKLIISLFSQKINIFC